MWFCGYIWRKKSLLRKEGLIFAIEHVLWGVLVLRMSAAPVTSPEAHTSAVAVQLHFLCAIWRLHIMESPVQFHVKLVPLSHLVYCQPSKMKLVRARLLVFRLRSIRVVFGILPAVWYRIKRYSIALLIRQVTMKHYRTYIFVVKSGRFCNLGFQNFNPSVDYGLCPSHTWHSNTSIPIGQQI